MVFRDALTGFSIFIARLPQSPQTIWNSTLLFIEPPKIENCRRSLGHLVLLVELLFALEIVSTVYDGDMTNKYIRT
jgi:hypothetical protein